MSTEFIPTQQHGATSTPEKPFHKVTGAHSNSSVLEVNWTAHSPNLSPLKGGSGIYLLKCHWCWCMNPVKECKINTDGITGKNKEPRADTKQESCPWGIGTYVQQCLLVPWLGYVPFSCISLHAVFAVLQVESYNQLHDVPSSQGINTNKLVA